MPSALSRDPPESRFTMMKGFFRKDAIIHSFGLSPNSCCLGSFEKYWSVLLDDDVPIECKRLELEASGSGGRHRIMSGLEKEST